MYQLRGKPQDLSSHTFCCSRSTFQLKCDSKESFNIPFDFGNSATLGKTSWLAKLLPSFPKSIGLTSSEGRNGETLGRHELNPRHLWYTTFWVWKMHVAIRLTMDEFQYLPGQICDSKLLQRNLAVHPISLMLHTSPRILTAWCRRQYGDPSRFPGVNLASALVSS